jgi:hypothetical protein
MNLWPDLSILLLASGRPKKSQAKGAQGCTDKIQFQVFVDLIAFEQHQASDKGQEECRKLPGVPKHVSHIRSPIVSVDGFAGALTG